MTTGEFAPWRKSSYSGGNSDCVEVATWRKSSYSGGNSECVEVGAGRRTVGVRDTQQVGHGPVLEFSAAAWATFIAATRNDEM